MRDDDLPVLHSECLEAHRMTQTEIKRVVQANGFYKVLVYSTIALLAALVIVGCCLLDKAWSADTAASMAVQEVRQQKELTDLKMENMRGELKNMDGKLDKLVETLVKKP